MELCYTLYKNMKESIIAKATKQNDKAAKKAAGASAEEPSAKPAAPSKAELIRAAKAEAKGGAAAAEDEEGEDGHSVAGSVGSSLVTKKVGKRERMRQEMMSFQDNIILGNIFLV